MTRMTIGDLEKLEGEEFRKMVLLELSSCRSALDAQKRLDEDRLKVQKEQAERIEDLFSQQKVMTRYVTILERMLGPEKVEQAKLLGEEVAVWVGEAYNQGCEDQF